MAGPWRILENLHLDADCAMPAACFCRQAYLPGIKDGLIEIKSGLSCIGWGTSWA